MEINRPLPITTSVRMKVHIAIPCFNDCSRLSLYLPSLCAAVADLPVDLQLVVVNDGSQPAEKVALDALVEPLRDKFPFLLSTLHLEKNQGKGGAILVGWDAATTDRQILGFLDADGAIPAGEVRRLLLQLSADADREKALFASRVKLRGRTLERKRMRHLSGRVFATMVGILIDPDVYDSQCGFKLIPSSAYKVMRNLLTERGFAFDVELLAALNHFQCPVEEVPIDWFDIPGSKVSLFRDSRRMFLALRGVAERSKKWPKKESLPEIS